MNQRIFNPPLAKAGEPTPADAQATATVRIPSVTATDNELSQLIKNANELKKEYTRKGTSTNQDAINVRIDMVRAKLEELKKLIQTEPLSAATEEEVRNKKYKDIEIGESDENTPDFIPAMRTIPTIVYREGLGTLGWAEVTYGKVEKPKNYEALSDDLYHIFVRIYWEFAVYDLRWDRESLQEMPRKILTVKGLEFPVPSSDYIFLSGFNRAKRSTNETWYKSYPVAYGMQSDNFYVDNSAHPGDDKTANIAMMLYGWSSVSRQNIGESEDTALYVKTDMLPAADKRAYPIGRVSPQDDTWPSSRFSIWLNTYEYCSNWVMFCTAQDLIEWNELAKRHPGELYEIPLID